DVLRTLGAEVDRDLAPERPDDQLEGLSEPRATRERQLVVLPVERDRALAPAHGPEQPDEFPCPAPPLREPLAAPALHPPPAGHHAELHPRPPFTRSARARARRGSWGRGRPGPRSTSGRSPSRASRTPAPGSRPEAPSRHRTRTRPARPPSAPCRRSPA